MNNSQTGNMAAGSPTAFLPAVLGEIQSAATDDRKLHLLLGAVKETLSYSNSAALADLSNALWGPLFQICESASAQQNAAATAANATGGASSAKAGDDARLDGTRNLAAECLGKITLTNPASYLGQLQSRLQADSPGTRAAVITAIRFTFTDASTAYDDLLAPLIVQFLSLMKDSDLVSDTHSFSVLKSLTMLSYSTDCATPGGFVVDFCCAQQTATHSRSHVNTAASTVSGDKD